MLLIKTFVVGLVIFTLNGCSWIYGEHGLIKDNEYTYVNAQLDEPLKTPKGLTPILVEDEYTVDKITNKTSLLGKQLDDSPPILILASGDKMGVDSETQAKFPRVWFRYDEIEFWQSIQDYLKEKKIPIASKDLLKGTIDTTWITEKDTSYWRYIFGSSKIYAERNRFQFSFGGSDQGKQKLLTVKHLARQIKQKSRDSWVDVSPIEEQASIFLNGFLGYWTENEDRRAVARVKLANLGIDLAKGKDDNDKVAYVADAGFQETWTKLGQVLKKLGFTIDDKDQSLGVYFAKYKIQTGALNFISSIFGRSKENILGLKEADYQFNLSKKGNKTLFIISQKEGAQLSDDDMNRMFTFFAKQFKKNLR